jgi:hypothetical protein
MEDKPFMARLDAGRGRTISALILACAIALIAIPSASAQIRLDIGVTIPKEIDLGYVASEDASSMNAEGFFDEFPFVALPEADLYYQQGFGHLKLGIGARAFSIFAESVIWPNAYAEYDYGRAAFEAQTGGGAFFMLGILPKSAFWKVFVPDISAWYRVGKRGVFRVGGGALGLYVPDILGNNMCILLYFGCKASILL